MILLFKVQLNYSCIPNINIPVPYNVVAGVISKYSLIHEAQTSVVDISLTV